MKEIWKYPLSIADQIEICMPRGAAPLCVMAQYGWVQLWVLVDPAASPELRLFRMAGTGHQIDDSIGSYIGSVQLHGGELVFHVFEVEAP